MLTSPSPRAVREISHSSVLAEQAPLIEFTNALRPWTSFRLGRVFSSLGICLHRKSRIAVRIALPAIILSGMADLAYAQNAVWNPQNSGVLESLTNPSNWLPTSVPTGTATFGPAVNEGAIPQTTEQTNFGAITFTSDAPSYDFFISPGNLTLNGAGIANPSSNEQIFVVEPDSMLSFIGGSSAGDNNAIGISE